MSDKNKILSIFYAITILLLALFFGAKLDSFYRTNLLKEIIEKNKVLWQIEDEIVLNSSFIPKVPPDDFQGLGFTEKYFLYDNIKDELIFKVELLKSASLGERQFRRFMRFYGCATPFLATLTMPINNKLYLGSIQQYVPHCLPIDDVEDIKKLNENQIRYLLKCRVLLYLLDIDKSFDIDVIISQDGTPYIVDLDRMLFPPEIVHAEFKDFLELLNFHFDEEMISREQLKISFEKIKKIPFERERITNISHNINNWRELCRENDVRFWAYLIRSNIRPNVEGIFKLINFINELSDDDFLGLIEMPELKGNRIWEDYLSLLRGRRRNLKSYWKLFFTLLNREYKVKFKFCFDKKYTLSELRSMLKALDAKIKELNFKKNQIIAKKEPQKKLQMTTCPEAWWIFISNARKTLPFNDCMQALLRLKDKSTSSYEKKAIDHYLGKMRQNCELKAEDMIPYYLDMN